MNKMFYSQSWQHAYLAVMLPGLRIKHLVHKNYFRHQESLQYDHPLQCHDPEVSLTEDWTSSLQILHPSRWLLRLSLFQRAICFRSREFQTLFCLHPSVVDETGSRRSIFHLEEFRECCLMISSLRKDARSGMKNTNEKILR